MEKKMNVVEHLSELRYRMIVSLATVLVGAAFVYLNMEAVVAWLTTPLGGRVLHFIGPADGFFAVVQIAVVGGVILGWPVLLYQALAFSFPGCTARERRIILLSILPGVLLFAGGAYFGNQVLFPGVLQFFLSTGESYLNPMLIGIKYFSFLLMLTLVMGVVFETPLAMIILTKLGFITSKTLRAKRIYAYTGILLIIGFFVPTPDLFTLLVICSPVIFLFELSIWLIYLMEFIQRKIAKSHQKKEKINYA